jgi:signal transduction histidine kinase/PAS domain-containing protein
MLVGTDAEIARLRGVLRDLVALFTIPASWVGSEPPEVAAGLADTLVTLLQLDGAFVRLCDPGGAGAVDVVRGTAWETFPQWLDDHLAVRGRLAGNQIVTDIRGGPAPCRGVVVPIGVDGEGGFVAAASKRGEFPTEIDQMLLSLAANHAATAFQSARLVRARRQAEEEARAARGELERKVAERTAELRRSEAYLAEAQRLAHTGSFALDVRNGEPTHSSDEHLRLLGFDPEEGVPSLDAMVQRIHPDDRAAVTTALERGIRESAVVELEYRIALPGRPLRYIRAVAHPVLTDTGELDEFVGTVMDVTAGKRAEEERQAQLWFFESMDRINRAIQGTSDVKRMMRDLLDATLAIFGCDRAWLMYPCDPDVTSHRVRMERTRPEYMGAFGLGMEIPNDPDVAGVFRMVLVSGDPIRFDPQSGHSPPSAPAERFAIKSMLAMAVHPKVDRPYLFGLHQCSHARVWTAQEERLFQAIGRRLADALDTLLMLQDVREAHRMVEASRDELRVLAEEQAALRRVATLVARGVALEDAFAAVAEEVGRLVSADTASILRYEGDGTATLIARWPGNELEEIPPGTRLTLDADDGGSLAELVLRSGRPARVDSYAEAAGTLAARARDLSFQCSAGSPIDVDGRLWGLLAAASRGPDPMPMATESRLAAFAELLGTAIAKAESRSELTASRARLVTAADETRRRLERDLHDGVQQRLVSLGLELRAVEAALPQGDVLRARVAQTATGLAGALNDLVEISRGIHPAILAAGGLGPALKTLARRSAVPVELELHTDRRLPDRVEVAVYYVVSEALTNAAKHAGASVVQVDVDADDWMVHLTIRDDGRGGADPGRGSGLIGLTDRVEALGGRIEILSPAGRGTSLLVRIPLEG